jgi:hypothetical protein
MKDAKSILCETEEDIVDKFLKMDEERKKKEFEQFRNDYNQGFRDGSLRTILELLSEYDLIKKDNAENTKGETQ